MLSSRATSCRSELERIASCDNAVTSFERSDNLLAHVPYLSLNRGGALARGVEGGEAGLTFLHRVAEVADPLAHRVQTTMLQLETFTALPHLLPQISESLTRSLLGILDLLRGRLQLLGARQHFVLDGLHFGELGLDRPKPADLFLLPAEPGVQLPVHPGELCYLSRGPVYCLALLLQHRGLLGHLVSQRLEHGKLVLDVGDGSGGVVDRLE